MARLDPASLLRHLDRVSSDRAPASEGVLSLALPFAMGVSLLVGCGGGDTTSTPSDECGNEDCADACGDRVDNDGDGALDCADADCATAPNCMQADYAAPLEVDCEDGLDDDGDGAADCADADCQRTAPNCMVAAYGIPMAETSCADGLDDDGDGAADCADADCTTAPGCAGGTRYAAPGP